MELSKTTAIAAVLLSLGAISGHAAPVSIGLAALPSLSRLDEGGSARAPLGFIEMCRRMPVACTPVAHVPQSTQFPTLNSTRLAALAQVNRTINHAIVPATDMDLHGRADVWSINPAMGDCEDYALTKRNVLIEQGWPVSSLLLAVVRDEEDNHHAVLVVRSANGDLVLDNRTPGIRSWAELPYRWIKLQSSSDPRRWVQLDGYVEDMIARKQEYLRRIKAHGAPSFASVIPGS